MSASAPPTSTSSHSFTICASLRRSVAWKSCRSIGTAESQGKERDVRGWTRSSRMRGRRNSLSCSLLRSTESREASSTSCKSWTSSTVSASFSSPGERTWIQAVRWGGSFLTLIGSIAELESDLIRERVLAGMRRAKLDGVRIGRAPMNIDRAAIVRDRIGGMTLTAVAKKWGISRSLVCKLVNRSRAGDEGSVLPPAQLPLILFTLCSRVQPRQAGD